MKRSILLILSLVILTLSACGSSSNNLDNQLVGKWAFEEAPDDWAFELRSDGTGRAIANRYGDEPHPLRWRIENELLHKHFYEFGTHVHMQYEVTGDRLYTITPRAGYAESLFLRVR